MRRILHAHITLVGWDVTEMMLSVAKRLGAMRGAAVTSSRALSPRDSHYV